MKYVDLRASLIADFCNLLGIQQAFFAEFTQQAAI
jgi:hypothetical protein